MTLAEQINTLANLIGEANVRVVAAVGVARGASKRTRSKDTKGELWLLVSGLQDASRALSKQLDRIDTIRGGAF